MRIPGAEKAPANLLEWSERPEWELRREQVLEEHVGVPDRLELTVVGPAVNEAVRIEGLTRALDRPVLASDTFARTLALPWQSVGRHALKGVAEPRELLVPPD